MLDATAREELRWLLSAEGAEALEEAAADSGTAVRRAATLRRRLAPGRARRVLEQLELRARAREKFRGARRMFFTRRGLEQATGATVAAYKARRFPPGAMLADLCCGIGGDLLALAERGPVVGVDRDLEIAWVAAANCRGAAAHRAQVVCADLAAVQLGSVAAWHVDPDRRPAGRRTSRVDFQEPPAAVLEGLRARCPHAAVKLAPSAAVPESWCEGGEREWIGHRGECRQQVLWCGSLAATAGGVRATVLAGGEVESILGHGAEEAGVAAQLGPCVFEPHAAVLAAGLGGALAGREGLAALEPRGAYLTGASADSTGLLAAFEVLESLPFDVRRLKGVLRDRRLGKLEIKKRGLAMDPVGLAARLRVPGDESGTLIVGRHRGKFVAILCRRRPRTTAAAASAGEDAPPA